jgi:hypothetical protein
VHQVVDDFSSKIGLGPPFETVETLDANHMQMARCASKEDPQYRAIMGVLKQLIRRLSDVGRADARRISDIQSEETIPTAIRQTRKLDNQG